MKIMFVYNIEMFSRMYLKVVIFSTGVQEGVRITLDCAQACLL